MRITSGGNVGIGTTSPGYSLEVNGDVRVISRLLVGSELGDLSGVGAYIDSQIAISGGHRITNQNDEMTFYANRASSGGFKVRTHDNNSSFRTDFIINSSGNVLIGTTTDNGARLQVSGAATFSSSVTATSFIPSGSTVPINGMYLPSANQVAFSTNTSERVLIASTGDILFKGQDTTGVYDARFTNNGNDLAFYASTITGGPSKSISFHGRWLANELRMRITINGNVMIGASSDSGDRLRVTGGNGNTFTDTITTLRPDTESKSVAWRLGVVSGGTTTPDRLIRVMVDGIEYNIPAREA
jgi:hypothetical protein